MPAPCGNDMKLAEHLPEDAPVVFLNAPAAERLEPLCMNEAYKHRLLLFLLAAELPTDLSLELCDHIVKQQKMRSS